MRQLRTTAAALIGAAALLLTGCGNAGPAESSSTQTEASGPTTIYVVRHGQTLFNVYGIVSGWSDSFLTEQGEEQATAAGRALAEIRFDAVLTSDLGRATQTTDLILAESESTAPMQRVHDLREQHYGGFDGRSDEDLWVPVMAAMGTTYDPSRNEGGTFWENPQSSEWYASVSEQDIMDTIAEIDPEGYAEDWATYESRLDRGLAAIAAAAEEFPGGTVLVVAHGGAIGTLLELMDESAAGVSVSNASISTVTYADGVFTVGDTGVTPEDF